MTQHAQIAKRKYCRPHARRFRLRFASSSLIVADANKQRSIPGSEWSKELGAQAASRAVKQYLATLDDAAFGAAEPLSIRPLSSGLS
jgi:hypothetical protein